MKLNTDTKNLSHTRQRDAIFSVLKEARRPLTRSEILELGRKQVPRLGSATVDRAIREFTELKKIVGVHYPGQPKRYELPSSKEHPHFICRRCSRLFDLEGVMELPSGSARSDSQIPPQEFHRHARLAPPRCATKAVCAEAALLIAQAIRLTSSV